MEDTPGDRVTDEGGEVTDRVRQVIGRLGCSQREFARRIVMDPSKLSRSLGGTRRFTLAEIVRIADIGAVDTGWLLGAPERPAEPAGREPAAVPEGGRPLQLVRETVRLIAEHGFHGVRVADIAAACGTSPAAVHYHFPGRDELLEAAVRWCMDEDTARRAAESAAAPDARAELLQLIALQIPRTGQQRRQWLVWLDLWAQAARSTAVGRLHEHYYRQWRTTVAEVVRRGVDQGVFRTVDPEFTALRLTALIDGLATQVLATAPDSTGPDTMHTALLAFVESELTPAAAV
ncbi:TetR family transcriptional regulator [Streptomyces sp. RPA4-5]|uniref:TetR/AcrR family transcriptional regulator n=1 Tax=unclassified Streptomyces TaxID=2593676 RepID=UPI00143EA66C|nr:MULTISPECIES: TetR/AcrR family transcriptional regulator [unclassified Streptomyces]QIY58600.1 TetR family transcriptional regulator [Streptomyces sp. RPA4-5]WJY41836.1 TetR family transcriptional regulator C-terminal domain-containing protein [Streptomyces sp. P9-2B-2]